MCGFTAYIGKNKDKEGFLSLSEEISYRGPDHSSFYDADDLMISFHRLSIIGEGLQGNQPIISKDNHSVLVCNGEIYNYKKLINDYDLSPRTTSDCEVILLLYNKIGIEKTLHLLDGVYSFFIHDSLLNVNICARDPFGVRPCFFGENNDGEYFVSSEAKSIPNSNFRIKQFPPGTWWSSNDPSNFISYYKKSFDYFSQPEEEVLKNIRRSLVSAVEKRMMSEREIGCLLSGGLDSSLISAIVCKLNNGYRLVEDEWVKVLDASPHRIKTFSIGMEGSPDLEYAKEVSRFINSDHYEVKLSSEEFISAIPKVIYNIESYDTTTVRASVGNYLISKAIRDKTNCKVVFNGDGSDEVCCGYVYNAKAPSDHELHLESERLLREIHFFDVLRSDRSISSNGLEPRTPFLDKSFVENYMSIHPSLKTFGEGGKIEKFLLRKSFEKDGLLPDNVLWRHKCAFSDGVSSIENSWHKLLRSKIDSVISDKEFNLNRNLIHHCKPDLKESYFYRKIFNESYEHCQDIIPHFWLPKWTNVKDPSARELDNYKE